jgi:hypothetical protein
MKTRTLTLSLCLLALAAALGACAAPEPAKNEQRAESSAAPAAQATPAASVSDAATNARPQPAQAAAVVKPPPGPQEVRAAVERIYKGAVAPEESAAGAAAVGDFNGDGAEDLVVRARPAPGRLDELNDEVANWIITDPRTVRAPDPRDFDPHQGVQKLAPHTRPQIEAGDALLVVVHGYKDEGWRNPEALQTYLLKGATGADLRAEARDAARAGARKHIPRLFGDVLREKLDGEDGFLYWTGATYGWFR